MISANRNLDTYARFEFSVYPDELAGFQAPLAGIASTLTHINTPLLLRAMRCP